MVHSGDRADFPNFAAAHALGSSLVGAGEWVVETPPPTTTPANADGAGAGVPVEGRWPIDGQCCGLC
jgi:hypothetical protein